MGNKKTQGTRGVAWDQADPKVLESIVGVCLDIDDTLSTDGKLTAEAYESLWALKRAGFSVIPVTGRPAGWCDHIARFWPVDAVVGENGAFTFYMEKAAGSVAGGGRVLRRIITPGAGEPRASKERLSALHEAILSQFPEARVASDQAYREYDLAIDIREDVPAWSNEEVAKLVKFVSAQGAHAKVSSIHVNCWLGDYDKAAGLECWLEHLERSKQAPSPGVDFSRYLFIGDSPNDEPLFRVFPYCVGVANLVRFLPDLKSPPTWITKSRSGEGFCEMVTKLVASRGKFAV